jgi:hypothetical protein
MTLTLPLRGSLAARAVGFALAVGCWAYWVSPVIPALTLVSSKMRSHYRSEVSSWLRQGRTAADSIKEHIDGRTTSRNSNENTGHQQPL